MHLQACKQQTSNIMHAFMDACMHARKVHAADDACMRMMVMHYKKWQTLSVVARYHNDTFFLNMKYETEACKCQPR